MTNLARRGPLGLKSDSPTPAERAAGRAHMARVAQLPSGETLMQLLRYEPDTGLFFWRPRLAKWFSDKGSRPPSASCQAWNKRYAGRETLTDVAPNGYLQGGLLNCRVLAHRVAWAMIYDEWPECEVDHANGNKQDNRAENLRPASRSQNCANRGPNRNRSKSFKCVYPKTCGTRWVCIVTDDGKARNLGTFSSEIDAARAYDAYAISKFGSYARLNLPRVAALLAPHDMGTAEMAENAFGQGDEK